MGATHHLHPNVRFLQLQSSDEKSTVRSDRKSLIKLKKANQMISLFYYIYLHVESDQGTYKYFNKKRAAEATLSYYSTPTITLVDLITATTSLPTAKPKSLTD